MATKKKVSSTLVSVKKPDLITASLQATRETWPTDGVSPGLVLSMLKTGEFYASVCRYHPNGNKNVIYTAKAISIESAVKQVMQQLLNQASVYDTLKKAIG